MIKQAAPKRISGKKNLKKDIAATYNEFKEYEGKKYSGMKIGRSHKWNYDAGVWKETKITPDLWEISYAVIKRRAGKAPEGSGAPVGIEYHWYILAHQNVTKLDANKYTTSLTGLKYKFAHKRAGKDNWSVSEKTQKKHLIQYLYKLIEQLEKDVNDEWNVPKKPTDNAPVKVKRTSAPAKKVMHKEKEMALVEN